MIIHKKQSVASVGRYSSKSDFPFPIQNAANNNSSKRKIRDSGTDNSNEEASKPRKADKRLWESLSQDQYDAAQQIYYGFKMRVAGMGPRTQTYSGMPAAGAVSHYGPSFLLEKFAMWSREARKTGVSVGCILDILVFGKSCRDVDRDHRKRKGFAKKNLVEGLEKYFEMKEKSPYK